MLRKIFSVLILLSVTICAVTTSAAKNPAEDSNLVKFYQHQGYENYLFKDSLRVEQKNSLKVISFAFIVYDSITPANTRWERKEIMEFAYDETARKVYFFDQNGELDYLDPNGTIASGSGYAQGAEIVYFLATRKKFYGTYDDNFYTELALKAGSPTYLDADKNYILFADLGIQGAGLYIDRKTVNVIQKDIGGCIISVDEVQVPDANFGKTEIANRYTHHYSYVYDKNVVMRFIPEEDKWVKVNQNIKNPEDENFTYDAKIAEAAYFLAFGKKFYGTFNEDFYNNLKS